MNVKLAIHSGTTMSSYNIYLDRHKIFILSLLYTTHANIIIKHVFNKHK